MAKKRGNNEGSIHKRKNGTWRALISVGGKRLSFTGKSRKECREWLKDMLHQADTGILLEKAQITLESFINRWLVSVEASLRPKTWQQYQQIVRDYIIPDLGKIKIIDLRPHHIQALYDNKVGSGVGLRTVQLIHSVLHRTLVHAVKLGLLARNPDDVTTPPKPKHREMRVYDEAEVQQLVITSSSTGDRNVALYYLAITTGMRQGELLGLKWLDVDWERKTIQIQRQLTRIPGKGFEFTAPKTKAGIRKISIGQRMLEILREHRNRQFTEIQRSNDSWQDLDLVFPTESGTPIHLRKLYRNFKKLLKFGNLPDIRFHDLRHTAASLMLNSGVPVLIVSKRLGHAKPSITLDIYGHLIPSMQEQAADVMDEIITPISFDITNTVAPGLHQHR